MFDNMKFALATVLCGSLSLLAADAPKRPQIVGLSHIAFYVHDMEKTRAFYKDFLGFAEPYSLTNKDGSLHLTWIKINDRQSLELFPEKEAGSDRLYHIALETDDAVAMRDYLAAHGVKVPAKVGKGKIGNLNYFVTDPDGHIVEMVQYAPTAGPCSTRESSCPTPALPPACRTPASSWATWTRRSSFTATFSASMKSGAAPKNRRN